VKLTFTPIGWADYQFWSEQDRKLLLRINALIEDIRRHPFTGIGKPEPLANELKGWWSRRITDDHRLIYRVTGTGEEQAIEVARCRYHYGPRRQ